MSNGLYLVPGRRVKDARGFKVKVFDVLHSETWWYSKTYSSLRNIKLAIAQGAFKERQFLVSGGWNAETLSVDYRMCVELYIYDVETWELAAIRKGDGGTDIVIPDDCSKRRAGEWEDKVRAREERDDE